MSRMRQIPVTEVTHHEGAAQLPVMAQDVKVGQSHGGFMPKAGGIDFQAFTAANQFLV